MENILKALRLNLIKDNRYLYLVDGLKNTMIITLFATILGIVLGLLIALIRTTYDNTNGLKNSNAVFRFLIKLANSICQLYITVIRGTPVVIQLMILFFCIFTSRNASGVLIAIIGFGLNSSAYVAEIFRSGLMSIDQGQMEAGRSLGLSYLDTMKYIIVPQAFKVVLPSLCNEFIVLIKETSVAGYVAVQDLTKGGDIIRSRTYDAWTPLLIVAGVYLLLTCIFSVFVKKLEVSLRKNERTR
ncbi:MAG: amino acid ABC transporter permease [Lachnospiraceae bacterium]|nr:amino acid ABC transporter permease [Lachnospiraceae bacterium]